MNYIYMGNVKQTHFNRSHSGVVECWSYSSGEKCSSSFTWCDFVSTTHLRCLKAILQRDWEMSTEGHETTALSSSTFWYIIVAVGLMKQNKKEREAQFVVGIHPSRWKHFLEDEVNPELGEAAGKASRKEMTFHLTLVHSTRRGTRNCVVMATKWKKKTRHGYFNLLSQWHAV